MSSCLSDERYNFNMLSLIDVSSYYWLLIKHYSSWTLIELLIYYELGSALNDLKVMSSSWRRLLLWCRSDIYSRSDDIFYYSNFLLDDTRSNCSYRRCSWAISSYFYLSWLLTVSSYLKIWISRSLRCDYTLSLSYWFSLASYYKVSYTHAK